MQNTALFEFKASATQLKRSVGLGPIAFGSSMPGLSFRHDSADGYRYGFNNQESENALGDYYSFEYRIHDVRLGKFLSIDNLFRKLPWNSPYVFAENMVISHIDLEGLEAQTAVIPTAPNSRQATYITTVAIPVIDMSLTKGFSNLGAMLVVGLMITEQGYGIMANYNYFGLGGASNNIPFASLEASFNYFDRTIQEKWPAFRNLLFTNSTSSDEINWTTNSGPYIRPYPIFQAPLNSYNYDPNNNEPYRVNRSDRNPRTKQLETVLTGMLDYGSSVLDNTRIFVGLLMGYSEQKISSLQSEIADINNQIQLKEVQIMFTPSAQINVIQNIQSEIASLNGQIKSKQEEIVFNQQRRSLLNNFLTVTDTSTSTSQHPSNQQNVNSGQVNYRNNIRNIRARSDQ